MRQNSRKSEKVSLLMYIDPIILFQVKTKRIEPCFKYDYSFLHDNGLYGNKFEW